VFPHGALAVDFFFGLSGFVIGHAYDARWGAMTYRQFFLRRLIRLHPMVILSTLLAAAAFLLTPFPGPNHGVSAVRMALTVAAALALLPYPALPDRFEDTHSLNGPTWTLLQEYIGNVAYAFVLRRAPRWGLALLLVFAALMTIGGAVHYGTLSTGFGWSNFWMAPVRLAFPFICGLLLYRSLDRLPKWRLGIVPLGILMTVAFAVPFVGPAGDHPWNGVLEAAYVIVLFPAIIWLGANSPASAWTGRACSWLGRLSYPLYIIHYPFIYWFIDYATHGKPTTAGAVVWAAVLLPTMMTLGWLTVRVYDEPVRAWLARRVARLPDVPGSAGAADAKG